MGANMARRLMRDGHQIVAYDVNPDAVSQLAARGGFRVVEAKYWLPIGTIAQWDAAQRADVSAVE